ncbi:50S ribosomal protein L6 [bacterium]|nr:50S ribosomal protein L6 [bacterium]
MSRIGKKPIIIPQGIEVKIKGQDVIVKGPKGEISQKIPQEVLIKKEENRIVLSLKRQTKEASSFWGLTRALLANNIKGVSEGFEKRLELRGIGYRAVMDGENKIRLEVGFSHPIIISVPEGIQASVEKNIIIISGINKQKVGEFAAKLRRIRPPEPYKGKGIRYLGEKVRRKEGKKAATTAA